MLKEFFSLQFNNRKTVLLFFLFLFQMLGIRLFQGWGIILTFIIFLILSSSIKLTPQKIATSLGLAFVAFIFQLFKGSSINYCILVSLYIIDACFMVYYIEKRNVKDDFKTALKIFLIQALLSVIVYVIVPKSLMWIPKTEGVHNLTFLYIFYYIPHSFFMGMPRLSGWAWEPGCLQMLINLYLVFLVFENAKIKELIIPSILLVLTGSSAGYAIYILILLVFFFKRKVKYIFLYIPIIAIISCTLLPYLWGNVAEKLSIGKNMDVNTSGAIRIRDIYTGIEVVKNYPLFGIDMSDLANSMIYQRFEDDALNKIPGIDSRTWHSYFDYAAGGYTNGFFSMHMLWGLLGILLLVSFVKCRLWRKWFKSKYCILFPVVILLTMVSSPISNTALFLFFCLYNVLTQNN